MNCGRTFASPQNRKDRAWENRQMEAKADW